LTKDRISGIFVLRKLNIPKWQIRREAETPEVHSIRDFVPKLVQGQNHGTQRAVGRVLIDKRKS